MKFQVETLRRLRTAYRYPEEPENMRILVNFFWHALLALVLVLATCAILYGLWELENTVGSIDSANANIAIPTKSTLNLAQLDATVQELSGRQERYMNIKTASVRLADPSQ